MSKYFEIIAPFYQLLSKLIFGQQIIKSQLKAIEYLPNEGRLVIIGGGDGTILPYINKVRPQLKIQFVDSSKKMIELAKSKVAPETDVHFLTTQEFNLNGFVPTLVLAPYIFDLFKPSQILAIIQKINSQCEQSPIWIVVDFDKLKIEGGPWINKLKTRLSIYFFKMMDSYSPKSLPDVFTTIRKIRPNYLKIIPIQSNIFSAICFKV